MAMLRRARRREAQATTQPTRSPARLVVPLLVLLAACCLSLATAVPVEETRLMAVDMGAEWTKTATLDFTTAPDQPPGVSVNILLNEQANRKSPPCVAFRCATRRQQSGGTKDGEDEVVCERSFAEEALSLSPRFPAQVVCGPALLLGHTTDEALLPHAVSDGNATRHVVSLPAGEVADHFLYHVSVDKARDAFEVRIPRGGRGSKGGAGPEDDMTFTPEELTAMLLGQLTETVRKHDAERNGLPKDDVLAGEEGSDNKDGKGGAAASAAATAARQGPRVRHAALTVPSFSTVAERQALIEAGEVAGLRVVRLVHSVTAAATALAYYREEQLFPPPSYAGNGAPPSYVMIYDMGSRQTEAAVFALTPHTASVPANAVRLGNPDGRRRGVVGKITLLAMATNRTLGGAAFDQCIARYWDDTYLGGRVLAPLGAAATPAEKREAGKQKAAVLRAANRARERLSANREAPVTIEGVPGAGARAGGAFTTTLSRSTFEQVCGELFTAAVKVRDDAIAATHGTVTSISQLSRFEVVGGAARMPKLLEMVSKGYRSGVVDRTLNGDEAVAVGTAYLGATAAEMLPRKFIVREALTNDIGAFILATDSDTKAKTLTPVHGDGSTAAAAAPLFWSHHTLLPATRSVLLTNVTGDFVFTLASPPALAEAVLQRHVKGEGEGLAEARAVCPGCFLQYNSVEGVAAALDRAALVAAARSRDNVKVTLNTTDVVLEAAVSESGLPYLRKAYLRAHYVKEESPMAPEMPLPTTAAAEAEANNTVETANGTFPDGHGAASKSGDEASDEERGNNNNDDDDDEDAAADGEGKAASKGETGGAKTSGATAAEHAGSNASGVVKVSRFVRTMALRSHVVYPGEEGGEMKAEQQQQLPFLPRGVNLLPDDIANSRRTLRQLQRSDDYRYACSHLRNTLEGHLISLRMLDAYANGQDITTDMLIKAGVLGDDGKEREAVQQPQQQQQQPQQTLSSSPSQDLLRWREVVGELSDWLDDYGETATRAALAERNARIERLKKGVTRVLASQ